MSQPAICNKCKDAGFSNELIKFEQAGTKPDGSKKWRILNAADGPEHAHKAKQEAPKTSCKEVDITKSHSENMVVNQALVNGINRLAAVIELMVRSKV